MMPVFMNGQMYFTGVSNYNFNIQDNIACNKYLVNNNAYYCFSKQELNLTSYKSVKQFGNIIIYKRV